MDSTTPDPAAPCAARREPKNGGDLLCQQLFTELDPVWPVLLKARKWSKREAALFLRAARAANLLDQCASILQASNDTYYNAMARLEHSSGGQVHLDTDDDGGGYMVGYWQRLEQVHRCRMIGSGRFKACPDCDSLMLVQTHDGRTGAYCDFCDTTFIRNAQDAASVNGGAA